MYGPGSCAGLAFVGFPPEPFNHPAPARSPYRAQSFPHKKSAKEKAAAKSAKAANAKAADAAKKEAKSQSKAMSGKAGIALEVAVVVAEATAGFATPGFPSLLRSTRRTNILVVAKNAQKSDIGSMGAHSHTGDH